MARLYDRLISDGYEVEVALAAWYRAGGYMQMLEQATVVACDNVAEYFQEIDRGDFVRNLGARLPRTVSPISPAFYEVRPPPQIARTIRAYGALAVTHDLTTEKGAAVLNSPLYAPERHGLSMVSMPGVTAPPVLHGAGDLGPVRFLSEWVFFYHLRDQARAKLLSLFALPAMEDGAPYFEKPHPLSRTVLFAPQNTAAESMAAVTSAQTLLLPIYLAVSFMHCKNVTRRDEGPSQYENRIYRKKHRRSLVRYEVLDIDPMRQVLRTEGKADEVGLRKALHICRGHFATYTQEKPLFGRVTGTFWKPQHVRGSAKEGAVVKDYRVKAPRKSA